MQPILSAPAADAVIETDTARFGADVIEASMETPIVVDFWAPWCGPCKTLGPVLEKAVRATHGKVRMVKLNIDENQQLAAQMRIQSIPMVYAFFQGQPVDGFQGAQPESQVKQFIDKLSRLSKAGPSPVEQALEQAGTALEAGDHATAGAIFAQILQHEPENAAAYAGLMRAHMGLGQMDQAKALLGQVPAAIAQDPAIVSVRSTLDLAEASSGAAAAIPALTEAVARNPDDHQSRYDLAMALYGAGKPAAAIDALLEIVRRERDWNDGAARLQLLKLFEAMGLTDPLTLSGRRRLSSLLFS
ncbi:MAG: thioredoxin [Inquilinaceae bacterium]